jgi:hypothetical protein
MAIGAATITLAVLSLLPPIERYFARWAQVEGRDTRDGSL